MTSTEFIIITSIVSIVLFIICYRKFIKIATFIKNNEGVFKKEFENKLIRKANLFYALHIIFLIFVCSLIFIFVLELKLI